MTRWLAMLPWVALGLAIGDWAGLRAGWWTHAPSWLAGLAAVVLLLALPAFVVAARRVVRGADRGAAAAQALALLGIVTALGAGGANWLRGLSGYVVLQEGTGVPLGGEGHLHELRSGPLARPSDLRMTLTLTDVELVPLGGGRFEPRSRLLVERAGHPTTELSVEPRRGAQAGSLLLHQGAFGFAPRIVLVDGTRTVFDRVVPFTTVRHEAAGLSFEGAFTVQRERLEVNGRLSLDSLDEGMRGHAKLGIDVRREGVSLGRGELLPGHFAQMADGWRVGLAGLEKWSEIDVSRRTYSGLVEAGAVMALAGLAAWPVAAWRRR